MFLEQGIKPENKFWKYLLGSVFIISASFIGQIPITAAVFYKTVTEHIAFPTTNEGVMKMFESNTTLFLVMISFVFAFAGIYFVVKFIHHQTLLSVVLGCALIPIQTTTEEYVFRGYLMQGFANLAQNRWFPLLMTSVIFGSMHWTNPEVVKMGNIIMIYYIGTGLFLGIITLMDEGMELALGFHAANNLVGALLVTSDWTVFQTNSIFKDLSEPSAGIDVILPVIVVYPILLFIFSKKYGWTNWKEKLTGKISNVELKA